jgi:hypothetical protein
MEKSKNCKFCRSILTLAIVLLTGCVISSCNNDGYTAPIANEAMKRVLVPNLEALVNVVESGKQLRVIIKSDNCSRIPINITTRNIGPHSAYHISIVGSYFVDRMSYFPSGMPSKGFEKHFVAMQFTQPKIKLSEGPQKIGQHIFDLTLHEENKVQVRIRALNPETLEVDCEQTIDCRLAEYPSDNEAGIFMYAW